MCLSSLLPVWIVSLSAFHLFPRISQKMLWPCSRAKPSQSPQAITNSCSSTCTLLYTADVHCLRKLWIGWSAMMGMFSPPMALWFWILDLPILNFILAQLISSSRLFMSLHMHRVVWSSPLDCRKSGTTHRLPGANQEDLECCSSEDGKNGTSHCNSYFQYYQLVANFCSV